MEVAERRWSMRHIQHIKSRLFKERGFTIVELTLVIVLLGILFPIFSSMLINTYHDAYYLNDKVKSTSETIQGLSYIEEGVRSASAFQATVTSPFSDFYGPHNLGTAGAEAWSYKGDSATSRVLITQNYSTTVNALSNGRQPVFVNGPDFDCTTQMYYQPQLTYMSIYFVKNNTLYRRILTDDTTSLCAGNAQAQKQSCPPYISSGSWDSSCEVNDEVLVNNVSSFSISYYQISQDGSSTQIDPTYSSSDPTILSAVDYANVSVTTSTRGGAVASTLTQRVTKVNQ
jgi:type II secretory pathway pseudopilin PulG